MNRHKELRYSSIFFPSTNTSMNNHIPKQNDSVMSSRISTPPNSNSSMASQESPRNNMFHNSPYTTPTKKDPSALAQNKVNLPPFVLNYYRSNCLHGHGNFIFEPWMQMLILYFVCCRGAHMSQFHSHNLSLTENP